MNVRIFVALSLAAAACAAPSSPQVPPGTHDDRLVSGEHVQSGTPLVTAPGHYEPDQFGQLTQLAPSGSLGELLLPLDVPDGARIAGARVSLVGGEHTDFDGVLLPFFVVERFDSGRRTDRGQISTGVNGGVDVSTTPSAYAAPHHLTMSGLSEVADTGVYSYALMFVGEDQDPSALAFVPGLTLLQWAVTYEIQ